MQRLGGIFIAFISSILFFSTFALAAIDYNYVISNSEDWKDVYSTMQYASFSGAGSDFLVSTGHGPVLLNGINKDSDIRVISSRDQPFILNYKSLVAAKGFEGTDEILVRNANLELINDLPEVTNFIIVNTEYGYNAIAAAPYAAQITAWVFFADRTNIDEIDSILSGRTVNQVLIYGFVEREVRDQLAKYDPEIIDTGDRFKDNIAIVEKYRKANPVKQVVLSNGEFIEKELMLGTEPVLFTGKENVPDQIKDYLSNSDIEVGVLVGSDLVGAATNIRRSTGISVIVKFARGARSPTGAVAAVEGLDLFYLPIPLLGLEFHSAKYNRATSRLEVTYKSTSNVPIFFKSTLTPKTESETLPRVGDIDAIFIAPNDFKTVVYPDIQFSGDTLTIEGYTLYGDTPTSLEKVLEFQTEAQLVNVIDGCDVEATGATYVVPKQLFSIALENKGTVDCWADVELTDVVVDGSKITIGSEGSVFIKSGGRKNALIAAELTDEDLEDNPFVDVTIYYGEKEDSLVKIFKGKFDLRIRTVSYIVIAIVIVLILIVLFLLLFFWRRRKKEEENY